MSGTAGTPADASVIGGCFTSCATALALMVLNLETLKGRHNFRERR